MLQKFTGNLVNPWRRCVTLYVTVHDKKDYLKLFGLQEGRLIASRSRFGSPSNFSLISVTMRNLLDQQLR